MAAFEKIPVFKRLYPGAMKRWARLTWTGGYRVRRYGGLLLLLDWRNYVDRQVGLLGGYERAQAAYFLARMKDAGCDCFIDVGANFGLYSLQAAQGGCAREIHAFEPDPRNFAQLAGNLFLNRLTGAVQTHALAVSDRTGMLAFRLDPGTSTGQTRVAADGAGTGLSATTLDDIFAGWRGKSIFIKIDIEGHEPAALRGARKLLRDNRCFLQIESYAGGREEVAGILCDLDYEQVHNIGDDLYFAGKEKTA